MLNKVTLSVGHKQISINRPLWCFAIVILSPSDWWTPGSTAASQALETSNLWLSMLYEVSPVLFLICLILVDIFHGVESFDNFESLATSIFIGKCKYFVPMQLLPCELVTAISRFISFNWKCDQRKREPFVLTPRGGNQTGERKSKTPITSFQPNPEQIWSWS